MITLEPRLKKKLLDIYLKMFSTSQAKSLEYELIMTTFSHFSDASDLYQKACLCLKTFIESQDQNRKHFLHFMSYSKGHGSRVS